MRHIKGKNRQQMILFPECIDHYIPKESQVRFIDAFVDSLNLINLGYTKAQTKDTGRRPYNPGDLLKLYLYGYLHRIRSSRGLEKETRRNIEVMWLLKRLSPNFKTIADFRKDNPKAIKATFRYCMRICRQAGLYKGELLAIDGSYFKAVNSKERIVTENKLKQQLSDIDKSIEDYLSEMDRIDQEEDELYGDASKKPDPEELSRIIDKIKKDKENKLNQLKILQESGESCQAQTDSDARLLKKRNTSAIVGYNVQTVVDAEQKLIVSYEVTNNANDKSHLLPMLHKLPKFDDNVTSQVVADSGYYNGEHIFEAEKLGYQTYIPAINTSSNKYHGRYDKEHFVYHSEDDTYRCPAGEFLTRTYEDKKNLGRIYYSSKSCKKCKKRSSCTSNKRGRVIYRYQHEEALDRLKQRNSEAPEMQDRRKGLVEHPYGTLKYNWGYGHFLLKGKKKVSGEMGLMLLAYNMKRILNIWDKNAVEKIREG